MTYGQNHGTLYYICRNHRLDNTSCRGIGISKYDIDKKILHSISSHVKKYVDSAILMERIGENHRESEIRTIEKEVVRMENIIKTKEKQIAVLYQDKAKGEISESEYIKAVAIILKEKKDMHQILEKNNTNLIKLREKQNEKEGLKTMDKSVKHLNREMIDSLIAQIIVHGKKADFSRRIEVHWRF